MTKASVAVRDRAFLGHPPGLYVCFLTELWERFAYYGVLSLLVLYLTGPLALADADGNLVVAAYGALLWMAPVLGGMVADRWLGAQRAVLFGSGIMACGLVSLGWPSALAPVVALVVPGGNILQSLFFSLAIVVVGVGLLKSAVSAVVGQQYAVTDSRRNAAFTIFYMGINVGGFLGPIVCGGVAAFYGLHAGLAVAGGGMVLAALTFAAGRSLLVKTESGADLSSLQLPDALKRRPPTLVFAVGLLGAIAVAWVGLSAFRYLGGAVLWFALCLGSWLLYFSLRRCSVRERRAMAAVLILIAFAAVFWSLYMQLFGAMTLFSDRLVDRRFLGLEPTASQLQAIPAACVILFSPLLAWLWLQLSRRGRDPSTPAKFAGSLLLIGVAFLVPAAGAALGDEVKLALGWVVLLYVLMVIGELCQAPIALNVITRVCPERITSTMIGAYFIALAVGSVAAGKLAALLLSPEVDSEGALTDPAAALSLYTHGFTLLGAVALGAALLLALMVPRLRRLLEEGLSEDESFGRAL